MARARPTTEIVRNKIEELGCELIGEYNSNGKIRVRCLCGHEKYVNYYNFLYSKTHLCKKCSVKNEFGYALEIRKNFLNELKEDGYFLFDKNHVIKSISEKLTLIDKDGYKYFLSCASIRKNERRGSVASIVDKHNPYSLENIKLWMKNNKKPYEFFDGTFSVCTEKSITLRCIACNSTWNTCWSYMQSGRGNCSYCSHRIPNHDKDLGKESFGYLYPEKALDWDYDKNDGSPFNYYSQSNLYFYWKCHVCGYEWRAQLSNITDKKKKSSLNCHNCFINNRLKESGIFAELYPEIMKDWDWERNKLLDPYRLTHGSNEYAYWICHKCGYKWGTTVGSRTLGRGCSHCASSEGEKTVKKFLEENMIYFKPQYTFSNCLSEKGKRLQFDFGVFYDNKLWFVCEVQGEHHYNPVDFGGKGIEWAQKQLEELQVRDAIKLDYCESNDIPFLRIPYWDFDKIPQILSNFLNLDNFPIL